MYFITTKRMLEVCFSAHPNIQYRTFFTCYFPVQRRACWRTVFTMTTAVNCGKAGQGAGMLNKSYCIFLRLPVLRS